MNEGDKSVWREFLSLLAYCSPGFYSYFSECLPFLVKEKSFQ